MTNEQKRVLAKASATFAKGHWTKEPPTEVGVYILAENYAYYPVRPSYTMTVLYHRGNVQYVLPGGIPKEKPSWEGWFWSAPIPVLPPPLESKA